MKRARNPWLPLFRGLSLLALGSIWAIACGGPQKQGDAGSVCFRADDCKDGLACVATLADPSKSVCTNDLSSIVSMVDGAPVEAAAAPDGNVADGAGATGGSAGTPPSAGASAGGASSGAGATGTAGKTGAGGKGAGGTGGAGTAGKSGGGAPSAGASSGGAATGGAGTGTAGTTASGGSLPVDAGNG